ncbi:diacylglycerol/lipid kinase family protein [Dictyobacter aurantiacus]|uniref:Diacylglycerol kinase n=1 Tax=Dictyobacter aurantiacus TaxID=1936993 RepID=A0A401Z7R8_9CHLR|nr:diacylglycerol kinase family protein [Dictyobacter aurantiacus]GCE02879.1 diacylglycerol kinase [Dictyobacter aurantiacus]
MATSAPVGKPLVILNPAANRGNMKVYRGLLQRHRDQQRIDYSETRRPGEAKDLAQQAAMANREVIVVGGDGTVHEVVNGLLTAGRRVPLGIVAAGSGNDFACNTLKLPRQPEAAIERALNGRLTDVDAGRVNDTYFANGFSIGMDAEIGALTNRMKNIPLMSGAGLYYVAALRQLIFGFNRCPWLTFRLDDGIVEQTTEKRYVLIAVTNGPAYGAGFQINPRADYTDGLLDVCIVDYTPLWRVLQIFPGVKQGKHVNEPEVTFYRARSIHIESKRPVTLQADGEDASVTVADAVILPGALWIRL